MKSHCISFRQIPHTTKLFLDYLDFTPAAQSFYPRSPRFLEWDKDESGLIQYPAERRAKVAAILERQNKQWGASPKTLENIERLRSGACALVTGQQVGLFGGPVFSIYKALTAVKLAQEAEKLGVSCVPVFWLATEDHDLAEVNQIRLPNAEAKLETLGSSVQSKPDVPVGTISFGPEILEAVGSVKKALGDSEVPHLVEQCYAPGENFGSSFAKLFAQIFAEYGVILLDGSDPELDGVAAPLYRVAIDRCSEINKDLTTRGLQLEAAGFHQQVRVTDSSTLLFLVKDGVRTPIQAAKSEFAAGDEKFSSSQLADLASSTPQVFSPNVLLRPVVQDYLLPTLAYVGGAAEVAYFAQGGVVYEKLLGRRTPIVPRFSATIVEPKALGLLEKNHLDALQIFQGPELVRETIGARRLPPNLQSSFEQATKAIEHSMKAVREAIAQLDKTLVESADNAASKMIYQITNLQARASRAELRQSEVISRHAEILSNSLYPDKTLQEREFAGIYFLAKYGRELMNGLLEQVQPDCLNHQILEI
ncbi:MAG TPA: bacillithiol biosynthesis cysteine-adding enzyme BshC [Terriglobales bacterium]|nr:bacillithiol biosynthesis cysteine-adding enzyme BshC [Terriglobales bacterium]